MDITQKRDRLYRGALIAAILFAVSTIGLLVCFKNFEAYFDSHGRIAMVAEAALVGQENASAGSARKRNFPVTLVDEPGAKLVIPFTAQVPKNKISVCEEFTKNKLVITLEDGVSYMEEGAALTSDSVWMEAVGVYKNDGDIVIEVYFQEFCGYETNYENGILTLSFLPLREQYERVAVVYTPWENRSSLLINEWNQYIQKLQENYRVKIFSTFALQEEYRNEDVINFANNVRADIVICMELVDQDVTNIVTICNPDYFIPEFGNVELAALMQQEYAKITGMTAIGVKACEEDTYSWLKKSWVPTALTQFCVPLRSENIEQTYTLNQKMMEALENIVKHLSETHWVPADEMIASS